MAFTLANLENHGGSGAGMKMWSYTTTDNKAAVKASGYFNDAAGLLSANDLVYINSSDINFQVVIAAITAGVVTTEALGVFI